MIQTRSPKIIFSNETALYMHELTDRDPLQYSICVPRGYGTIRLRKSGLAVYTIKEELHIIGKETMKTIHGRDVFVYNQERTICDCVRYRNHMDMNTLSTALKRYTASRQKNLSLMMEYAKAFHIEKALRHYMEVLL